MLCDVLDALEKDVRRFVEQLGVPDVILFTGDLAFSGTEYLEVDQLLRRIRGWFVDAARGSAQPLLFAVPGNHDLTRPSGYRMRRQYSVLADYANGDDPDVQSLRQELWPEGPCSSKALPSCWSRCSPDTRPGPTRQSSSRCAAMLGAWWYRHDSPGIHLRQILASHPGSA